MLANTVVVSGRDIIEAERIPRCARLAARTLRGPDIHSLPEVGAERSLSGIAVSRGRSLRIQGTETAGDVGSSSSMASPARV